MDSKIPIAIIGILLSRDANYWDEVPHYDGFTSFTIIVIIIAMFYIFKVDDQDKT